ncbi:hypothetical protein HGB47_16410 [Leptospira yasudae]|uniref:hypothetical protein n=1 Tax=Leptospira yasudae TaxID=2202201 RepID=UPI001C4E8FE0|nr:hypothetical protein [Leptospira yasudae]MBW0435196.1 hypothetical protein [Leptospira yasudae]
MLCKNVVIIYSFVLAFILSACAKNNGQDEIDYLALPLLSWSGTGPFKNLSDFPCEGNVTKATASIVNFKTSKERSGKGCRRYYKYPKDFAIGSYIHVFTNELQNSEFLKYYISYPNHEISDNLTNEEIDSYEQSANFIYIKKKFQGQSLYIEPGSFTYFIVEALAANSEYTINFDSHNVGFSCNSGYYLDNFSALSSIILPLNANIQGTVQGLSSPCFYEFRTNVANPALTISITGATNLGLSVYAEKDLGTVEYSLLTASATKTLNNIPVGTNSRRLIKVDGLNAGSCPSGCTFNLSIQ